MATPTYTLIDSVTLGSSAATVTFSSIPAGGDLILVGQFPSDGGGRASLINLNGDSGGNYYRVHMVGRSLGPDSGTASGSSYIGFDAVATSSSVPSSFKIQAMDYSATDKQKSMLAQFRNSDRGLNASAHRWASTAAITSISWAMSSGDISAGSSFFLYNIAKAL